MPFLQHRGVGTHLKFARSDHSIPIPRPAFDQKQGIENACQKCHPDHDLAWQEAAVRKWYGELKPHHPMIESLLRASEAPPATAAAELLAAPIGKHPIAQASGLISFIKRFVQPDSGISDPELVWKLKALSASEDLDVRALALTALYLACNQQPDARALCAAQLRDLPSDDPVRHRWAVAVSYCGDAFAARGDTRNAILAYNQSLEVKPDSAVTLSHLASASLKAGDSPGALGALQKAVALQPSRAVLHFQLALIYQQRQQTAEAIRELEIGLQYSPGDPTANRMLQQLRR